MSSLIEQLLNLARADSGKEQWNFAEVNLGKLITNLSTDVEVLCQEKGLSFQLGQTQDLVIEGDEARLRELFMTFWIMPSGIPRLRDCLRFSSPRRANGCGRHQGYWSRHPCRRYTFDF